MKLYAVVIALVTFQFVASADQLAPNLPSTYQVNRGDTLSNVLFNWGVGPLYGKHGKLRKLHQLNPGLETLDKVEPGQLIKLCKSCPPILIQQQPIQAEQTPLPSAVVQDRIVKARIVPPKGEETGGYSLFGPRQLDRKPSTESKTNRIFGYFLQPSIGLVRDGYSGGQTSSSWALRIGGGIYYGRFEANVFYRRGFWNLSSVNQATPEWYQLTLGYGWDLPSFWGVKPVVMALVGAEYFKNKIITAQSFSYLSGIQNNSIGFRSRFTFGKRWDLGGTLLAGFLFTDTKHLYLQGDLSYWITERFRVGAGYWFDYYQKKTATLQTFENASAAELLTAFYF